MLQAAGIVTAERRPSGAVIVVWRQGTDVEFLLLRRGGNDPSFVGDWVWGPPSGMLEPGEAIAQCAARELDEETGLTLSLRRIGEPADGWPVFLAEAPADATVRLSAEHDQFAWLSLARAVERTLPELVRTQLRAAAPEARRSRGHGNEAMTGRSTAGASSERTGGPDANP